jgi:lipoyl(octanoyl) transferase
VSELAIRFLGRVPYGAAQALQERLVACRRREEIPDTLLLLEHPPVVTLGRGAHAENLLMDEAALRARGIELHDAGRGGDVTYHGPGQLVGYAIVALAGERRDAHRLLRDLEGGLIDAVAPYGIAASRRPGLTGVWAGGAKLAAIGVRIGTGWITSHGFALNVGRDLSGFETIIPCGIRDAQVTSLALLTGRDLDLEEVARAVVLPVAEALGRVGVPEKGQLAAAIAGELSSRLSRGGP